VRRVGLGSASLALAALGAALLSLGGCSGGDDDATIGTPTAVAQGLALTPAPAATPTVTTTAVATPVARMRFASYAAPAPIGEPSLSSGMVAMDADLIAAAMAREAPAPVSLSAERQQALVSLAQQMATEDHLFIRQPQLVLIVDRAPHAQLLAMTLAEPDGGWRILGARHVSTGKPGRLQHFKTPVGVLLNDGSEIGYRAQGTFNQYHIRGLGVKGMRVWDFGWQTTDDWRTPGATMEVRVEMHATDPSVLEARIGRADSEGCVRLPDSLNRFLDRHGIIDAAIERLGDSDSGYRALLSPELDPTPLAGDAVIVIDSSEPGAKPYPPETSIALSD
jgi:hypothetical protein